MVRPIVPHSVHREETAQFVRWALAQLGIAVQQDQRDAFVELPEPDRAAFAGEHRLRLPLDGRASAGQESLAAEGRFLQWIAHRLAAVSGGAVHARPLQQPMTVADVTGSLFSAYQVDGGQVHLAGCQLTDHPFLRLSFAADDDNAVHHFFVAPDGSSVSNDLAPELGLACTIELAPRALEVTLLPSIGFRCCYQP